MQNLQEKSKTPSKKPGTRVRVLWSKAPYNLVHDWTQTCVWAIEQFGLPGGKYYTHSTEDSMDFYFYDEKDAIHFGLRWL